MRTFGIIGHPLSHSFSPPYFLNKFLDEGISDCEYVSFPLENIQRFTSLCEEYPYLSGLNVTIPHKESIIPYLDELSPEAQAIGAVNCIQISKLKTETQKLVGHNTDAYGFQRSIEPLLKPNHNKALILGTGGAAKAVKFALNKLSIEYKTVSRNNHSADYIYGDLPKGIAASHQLIINTTPVGMHPEIKTKPPIPYSAVTKSHLLFDLIYNPSETKFLQAGKKRGAGIKNGLEMLHLQADKSWEIWNSTSGE